MNYLCRGVILKKESTDQQRDISMRKSRFTVHLKYLAFPGLFRGALEARATRFTSGMKFAAVDAIAESVLEPTAGQILPPPFDRSVAVRVAQAVREAAAADGVCHAGC